MNVEATTALPAPPSNVPPDTRFLDGLRGLAALYVVIHHASYLLQNGLLAQTQSFGKVTGPETNLWLFRITAYALAPFRWGTAGVMFFFVLSGFVIHLRYSKQLHAAPDQAKFQWGDFVWRRAKRIYPPLLLAMALSSGLYFAGSYLAPALYHQETAYSFNNQMAQADQQWTTFLGNLAFVAVFYVPPWAGNGPLWSLTYEWWFYMVYPLIWWCTKRSIWLATTVMAALFVLSLFPKLWPIDMARHVLGSMLTWWLGALLADVYTGRLKLSFGWIAWLTPMLACAAFGRSLPDEVKRVILGLGFSGLIALCFWLRGRGHQLKVLSLLKPLGDMSYTLYVIHLPILLFLSAIFIFNKPAARLPDGPQYVVVGIVVSLVLAWLLHFVAERPFMARQRAAAKPPIPETITRVLSTSDKDAT